MSDNHSSHSPWLGLLLFATIGSSIWFASIPLVSHRPLVDPPKRDAFSDHPEHVPSRLWQDPFEALKRVQQEGTDQNLPSLTDELRSLGNGSPGKVLLTFLPGGQYPEDAESRLRSRRATVAALAMEHYMPQDAEHLSVVNFQWEPPAPGATTGEADHPGGGPAPVDFFDRPQTTNRLAVVWLAESLLGAEAPLARLNSLVAQIKTIRPEPDVQIIGPRTSGMLKAMLEECARSTNGLNSFPALSRSSFYSSWATADDQLLVENDAAEHTIRQPVADRFAKAGLQFQNFVHTDRELCRTLVGELANRGHHWPAPGDARHDAVVIIAEHDTAYGRGLPLTFTAEALRINQPGAVHATLIQQARDATNAPAAGVYRFGYLRGTDGERPVATDLSADDLNKARRETMTKLEQPEGPGQLDYLRRLARSLRDFARNNPDIRSVKAIGVLGSDFYDKTLVLQALRPVFPEAIYFTTDLDARMAHPSHLRWTRNLVIASSRGLQPDHVEGMGIAGFREAYQTTLFDSVRAAVNRRPATELNPVSLFEIGRTRAVPLLPGEQNAPAAGTPANQPVAQTSNWHRDAPKTITLAVLTGLLLWHLFPQLITRIARRIKGLFAEHDVRRTDRIRNRSAAGFLVFMIGALIAFPAFILQQSASNGGEPLYLFEGVSVWPSELVRLLTFLVGTLFFLAARDALRENKRQLNRDFDLPVRVDTVARVREWWLRRHPPTNRPRHGWAALRWCLAYHRAIARHRLLRWTTIHPAERKRLADDKTRMEALWEDYNALGYSLNRLWRVAGSMVLFTLIGFTMMWIYGEPAVPYRGAHPFLSDKIPLILAVVTQVFLTFFVFDAALLCRSMIKGLTHQRIKWSPATCKKFGDRYNLAPGLMEEWLDIQLISRRTTVIMPLIYYPFITLFLLILARSSLFDNWAWPWALLAIISLITLFALGAVWILRGSAELARRTSLHMMREKLLRLMAPHNPDTGVIDRFRELIKEVETCRLGAFAPLAEQPLLKAVAVPFGGAGILAMIETFAFL